MGLHCFESSPLHFLEDPAAYLLVLNMGKESMVQWMCALSIIREDVRINVNISKHTFNKPNRVQLQWGPKVVVVTFYKICSA